MFCIISSGPVLRRHLARFYSAVDTLEEQIAAANADRNNETYVKRASRFVTDQETGERVKRDVPVQFRRWWWTDASNGKTFIQLSYGNKPLDLAKGKATIELKSVDDLVPIGRRVLLEQGGCRDQESRRAVSALNRAMFQERLLQRA